MRRLAEFIEDVVWLIGGIVILGAPFLLLIFAAVAPEHVTVDGREYEIVAHVTPMPCDDTHPDGCRRRTVGTRKPEVAQISIVGYRNFEVTCKTAGCAEDSREEWVRIAIRRQK